MTAPQNNLRHDPVRSLIRRLAIPASVGIMFHTMFNVTDTYFGGQISSQALAALSLSFPVFFIIISLGAGIQTGTTALIGNALGEGDKDKAMTYAAQGLSFGLFASVCLTIIGRLAAPWMFSILGAQDEYLALSMAYISPIINGIIFFLINYCFNSVLVASGDTKSYRNVLIGGCLINFGLDPWFLYGGFGLPAMGVAGVAWATVIIQALTSIYMGWRVAGTGLVRFKRPTDFVPSGRIYLDIAGQGLPAGFSMMTVALGIFVITYFFSKFGQAAVAAYGIATRVEQIVLMPISGLNTAALTIVAQNGGAQLYDRVRETNSKARKYGFLMLCVGGMIVYFFARSLMATFTDDQAVIDIGVGYLKIAAFILPSYPLLYVNVASLQGLKRPAFALWIGLYRQIAAPVVAFYGLAYGLGLGLVGVWWGIFLVTWSATLISLWYVHRVMGRLE